MHCKKSSTDSKQICYDMELGWGLFWVTFTFCMCLSVAVCLCLLFYVRSYLYRSTNDVSVFFKIPFIHLRLLHSNNEAVFAVYQVFLLLLFFNGVFFVCVIKVGIVESTLMYFSVPSIRQVPFHNLTARHFEWAIASGSEKTSGEVDCSFPDSAMLVLFCNVNRAYLLTLSLVNNSLVMPQWLCCWFHWCLSEWASPEAGFAWVELWGSGIGSTTKGFCILCSLLPTVGVCMLYVYVVHSSAKTQSLAEGCC